MNATIREGASFVASAAILGAFTGGIGSAAVLGGTLFLTGKAVDVTDLGRYIESTLRSCDHQLANFAGKISEIAGLIFLTASIGIATGLTTASLPATMLFLGATLAGGIILQTIFDSCCKEEPNQFPRGANDQFFDDSSRFTMKVVSGDSIELIPSLNGRGIPPLLAPRDTRYGSYGSGK